MSCNPEGMPWSCWHSWSYQPLQPWGTPWVKVFTWLHMANATTLTLCAYVCGSGFLSLRTKTTCSACGRHCSQNCVLDAHCLERLLCFTDGPVRTAGHSHSDQIHEEPRGLCPHRMGPPSFCVTSQTSFKALSTSSRLYECVWLSCGQYIA